MLKIPYVTLKRFLSLMWRLFCSKTVFLSFLKMRLDKLNFPSSTQAWYTCLNGSLKPPVLKYIQPHNYSNISFSTISLDSNATEESLPLNNHDRSGVGGYHRFKESTGETKHDMEYEAV